MKNFKLTISLSLLALVSILGIGTYVFSYSGGSPNTVIENMQVENFVNEAPDAEPQETLGYNPYINVFPTATPFDNSTLSEISIGGTFQDATNTVVSFYQGYGNNAILTDFTAYIENGTSTADFTCGTSTLSSLTADPTDKVIDDYSLATSTLGTATSTYRIVQGSQGGTNGLDAIPFLQGEYFDCYVAETDGGDGGWHSATNMGKGTWHARLRFIE